VNDVTGWSGIERLWVIVVTEEPVRLDEDNILQGHDPWDCKIQVDKEAWDAMHLNSHL